MFFLERCYNGGRRHDFQPRYTEEPAPWTDRLASARGFEGNSLRELIFLRKYVYDVCVWCGSIAKESRT